MDHREELLIQLRSQPFDLLVIGGGIVGAGIARDAAMRGLRVALIEKGDFASGASSKTSKLIHGGLRYLEHGHLGLVMESLRERHLLRTIATEFVHPLPLLIPVYRGDPRPGWKIRLGLALYDGLAFRWMLRRHQIVSAKRALQLEPRLKREGLSLGAVYSDCQMDDARLCLANILQAVAFGAVCCNYVRLLEFRRTDGMLCGAVVEDRVSARTYEVSATVVVNATGPWADDIRRLSDRDSRPRLAPTKGIHLIVPRLAESALFVTTQDRRMIFVLPWGDYSIIGTTESDDVDSLDALSATPGDVEYLLEETRRVLPEARLEADAVLATYAGARPLLAFAGSATRASREHRIECDRFGLVSVMGGKYTTFRRMAEEAVDTIVRQWRLRADRCLTDQVSLLEPTHPVTLNRWQAVTRQIAPELLARLLTRYGTGAFGILQLIEFDPTLARPLCPHHEEIEAEIVHAMSAELACTLSDVLMRRTRIAWSACQGLDMLSTIAELFQRYCQMSPERVSEQIAEYHEALARSLAFRQVTMPEASRHA